MERHQPRAGDVEGVTVGDAVVRLGSREDPVPEHPVVPVQVDRRVHQAAEFAHRGDVVVVAVGEQDGCDFPAGDGGRDGGGVVGRIDHQAFLVIADDPDVVVHVPGAAVERKRTRGDELLDPQAGGGGAAHSSTTERSTAPECIFSKAASMSLIVMRSVTKASRSSRPCR